MSEGGNMIDNLNEKKLFDLADLFKVLGDSTRLRIMFVLIDGKRSVGDIAETLGMSQSAISHQLKSLRESNLVKSERDGKSILYELADDHVKIIFKTGLEHIEE